MLSERFTTCARCGKKPEKGGGKVTSFTIGDEVLCQSCAPPRPRQEMMKCPTCSGSGEVPAHE